MLNIWTKQEDCIVKEMFGKESYSKVAETLGRTPKAVEHRSKFLGLSEKRYQKIWTEEEKKILVTNYGEVSLQEIAELLSRTVHSVKRAVSRFGLKGGYSKTWTSEDYDYLIKNYLSLSTQELSEKFSVTPKAIRAQLTHLRVRKGKNFPYKGLRVHLCNDNFFSDLSLTSAYWAGFIAADGNIDKERRRVSISIHERDKGHLERFCADTQFNGPISHGGSNRWGSFHPSCNVHVSSAAWVRSLQDVYNIIPNKTLILTRPNLDIIGDRELCQSYIIGCLDGDGYISTTHGYWSIGFCGTYDMMCFVKEFFDTYFPSLNPRRVRGISKDGNIYKYNISGKRVHKLFRSGFCGLDLPYLERKWSKIFNWLGERDG